MKKIGMLMLTGCLFILLWGCATPGQESFNQAQEFLKQNRLEEAIARLEQAIVQEPNQSEYKKALSRGEGASREAAPGRKTASGGSPLCGGGKGRSGR